MARPGLSKWMEINKVTMTDEVLQEVADRGYFVQNVFQRHSRAWEATLRRPDRWPHRVGTGLTLAQALRNAMDSPLGHNLFGAKRVRIRAERKY